MQCFVNCFLLYLVDGNVSVTLQPVPDAVLWQMLNVYICFLN